MSFLMLSLKWSLVIPRVKVGFLHHIVNMENCQRLWNKILDFHIYKRLEYTEIVWIY